MSVCAPMVTFLAGMRADKKSSDGELSDPPSLYFIDGQPFSKVWVEGGVWLRTLPVGTITPPDVTWSFMVCGLVARGVSSTREDVIVPCLTIQPMVAREFRTERVKEEYRRFVEGRDARLDMEGDLLGEPVERLGPQVPLDLMLRSFHEATKIVGEACVDRASVRRWLDLHPWLFLFAPINESLRLVRRAGADEDPEGRVLEALRAVRARGRPARFPDFAADETVVASTQCMAEPPVSARQSANFFAHLSSDQEEPHDRRATEDEKRARTLERQARRLRADVVAKLVGHYVLPFWEDSQPLPQVQTEQVSGDFLLRWVARSTTSRRLLVMCWGQPERFIPAKTSWMPRWPPPGLGRGRQRSG